MAPRRGKRAARRPPPAPAPVVAEPEPEPQAGPSRSPSTRSLSSETSSLRKGKEKATDGAVNGSAVTGNGSANTIADPSPEHHDDEVDDDDSEEDEEAEDDDDQVEVAEGDGDEEESEEEDESESDEEGDDDPPVTLQDEVAAAAPGEEEEDDGAEDEEEEDDDDDDDEEAEEVDEEDEEDEDDDDDDDDEDEEPVLKYSRLEGRIPELLGRDSATAIDVSPRVIAIGTQMGMVHVLSYGGAKVNSFRPHAANVTALRLDEDNDFVATASMEGRVVIHSLTSTESYAFDYKRPMNAIALEPGFAKKNTRAFVCGGMLGNLVLQEKGWLGYREQVLHSGEGPIWAIEWRGDLIAWANDLGVKIYDRASGQRIGYIDRGAHAPRAELFKCTLKWKDDQTLVIGWAEFVKIVRIRQRPKPQPGMPPLSVEVSSVWEVDCMVSGLTPYQNSAYIMLAYIPPDTYDNEATQDRAEQRRKAANRPEVRIIRQGDEIAADELAVPAFERYSCNDYTLIESQRQDDVDVSLVLTPQDIIVVRPRDEADHIDWLVERERFEEALTAAEALRDKHGGAFDVQAIGLRYMHHLVEAGNYEQAATLAPKVLGESVESWEKWIYSFVQQHKLPAIIPYIPVSNPQLSKAVYEMVLGHLLVNDKGTLLETVKTWPIDIYDSSSIIGAVQSELEATKDDPVLLEVMAEIHIGRGQPARALPFYLRLRKPNVFDLIREHNLFDAVQEQALLLVEFDRARIKADPKAAVEGKHGAAIQLLVDHTLSIPVDRVVQQLEPKPQYLYMYLDALFSKDPQACQQYSDRMVELYAKYDHDRLMPFLRASNFYDLERALRICEELDFVHETVFLLGRMGDNLKALNLIIERLGDVRLAITFAEEQRDDDLWEALITHSETRPDFIRALLEHGGAEIKPVRLIERIKEGLEIPGLKPALVKVLQASNLQVSLLEGQGRRGGVTRWKRRLARFAAS
ncbi:Vacuolar protein sorting-associated protein 41 [Vanrija albida]|uniref:Vacuolar protein sorting-associated protein 41 n=1 Tax=Vanrija albida TaxID=181172 RepID=A0ABR3QCD7_9TREE